MALFITMFQSSRKKTKTKIKNSIHKKINTAKNYLYYTRYKFQ